MEWSKLKTIILLILLCTNGFLLILVGTQEWNNASGQSAARNDALTLLAQNGIEMEPEALPLDAVLPQAEVRRDRETEPELLTALLGDLVGENLGGGQYLYQGEKGYAYLLSRGEFTIILSQGAYPVEGTLAAHATDTLALLDCEAQVLHTEGNRAEGRVTLIQLWEESIVLGCEVTAVYRDGCLVSLSGTRLSGAPSKTGSVELPAVTGLLRFLEALGDTGDVCSRITRMQTGYRLSSGLSDTAALVPVWYIQTDTGAYALDAVSFQLHTIN